MDRCGENREPQRGIGIRAGIKQRKWVRMAVTTQSVQLTKWIQLRLETTVVPQCVHKVAIGCNRILVLKISIITGHCTIHIKYPRHAVYHYSQIRMPAVEWGSVSMTICFNILTSFNEHNIISIGSCSIWQLPVTAWCLFCTREAARCISTQCWNWVKQLCSISDNKKIVTYSLIIIEKPIDWYINTYLCQVLFDLWFSWLRHGSGLL